MVQDEHSLFREQLSAYALGALDADEVPALEAHLQTCNSCQAELAEYRAISDGLLAALPAHSPSPALRKQLQARLPSAQKKYQPRFNWSFGKIALGGALVLLLVINVFSLIQVRQVQGQQLSLTQQLRTSEFALSMLAYPGTQSIPIAVSGQDISGSVLLDRERNTVALVMWHLPQLNNNQTYQAWLIEPSGDRVSAGTFRPEQNETYTTHPVYAHQNLDDFKGIGVTVEPAGGSNQPTGPRLFKVDF